jgi:hypothetical protein
MGRYASAPEGGSGDFQDVEPGNYAGRCYRIIDLGTTHEEFEGEVKPRNQVMISFELPDEKMNDGRPFSVSLWVTNSLHEKATLRKVLETWRKRPFTAEELGRFDLQTILGVTGMVTVGKTAKGRAKALGVGPLPKGLVCGDPVNPKQSFWLDEFTLEKYEALPEGIQGLVAKSDEYKAIMGGGKQEPSQPKGASGIDEDDIPF